MVHYDPVRVPAKRAARLRDGGRAYPLGRASVGCRDARSNFPQRISSVTMTDQHGTDDV